MGIEIKVPGGGAELLARVPGMLDAGWPRWRNLHSGKAGRGAAAFQDSRSKYAGTSGKCELLIGDLHDVLQPPQMGTSRGTWRRAGLPTPKLPSPPTLLGLQLHPLWSTASALLFFAFDSLEDDALWFELRRTIGYARISVVALPALTATSVHP